MATRLPLGKQQFKAILNGLANPLKGIIQPWDDPLSVFNGEAFVCYRTESVKIEKNTRITSDDSEEENFESLNDIEIPDSSDETEEEKEEKKSPKVNNRFVKIHYYFTPDKKLNFPNSYKFAIQPHNFFQLSKEKCADLNINYNNSNNLQFDLLNENGSTILSASTEDYKKEDFLLHKKRFKKFEEEVFENAKIIVDKIEIYSEVIEKMMKKHCIIYYSEKDHRIEASNSMAIFDLSRKYQTRLDKNLFPKLSKTDHIALTIGKIKRNIKLNIPECFIMKFDIESKLYNATVYISGTIC